MAKYPGSLSTHSGCWRYTLLSTFTISGSTQIPNCIPNERTWEINGARPCGYTSLDTTQSPSPAASFRRAPNQPSSRTKRSTPHWLAVSANARNCCSSWLKYTASHVLSETFLGSRIDECLLFARTLRCNTHDASFMPRSECAAMTNGVSYFSPGSKHNSPGCNSSPNCAYLRPSGSTSANTEWLPLHATCAAQTLPAHSVVSRCTAHSAGMCS